MPIKNLQEFIDWTNSLNVSQVSNSTLSLNGNESYSSIEFIYFGDGKYQGGLPEIDQVEKPGSMKTQINGHDLGLDIELKRTFKTVHLSHQSNDMNDI